MSRETNSMILWAWGIAPWSRVLLLPIVNITSLSHFSSGTNKYIITNLLRNNNNKINSRTVLKEDVKWGALVFVLGLNK